MGSNSKELALARQQDLASKIDDLTAASVRRLEAPIDASRRWSDVTVQTKIDLALALAHKAAMARKEAAGGNTINNTLNIVAVNPRTQSITEWEQAAKEADDAIEAEVAEVDDPEGDDAD